MKIKVTFGIVLASLLFLLISLFTIFINPTNVIVSPDEFSNKIVTEEYSRTGNMYIESEFLEQDLGNNLHPRGLITFNKKLVPFNYLGFPLFFGPAHAFFGDYAIVILRMLISIMFILVMVLIFRTELGSKKKDFFLISALVLCTPLLYYLNFFYYNIIPAVLFSLFSLYYLIKFNKEANGRSLLFCLFFALVAIFFRYEFVLFVAMILFINLIKNRPLYFNFFKKWQKTFLVALILLFVFIIPLLYLNNQLYGNPLTYGFSLFNKVYFPEERTGSAALSFTNILLPGGYTDLATLNKNIVYGLFLVSPILFLLGFSFLLKTKNKGFLVYFIPFIYLILYTGMNPNTYLSGTEGISLSKSVIRYWLIIFTLAVIPFATFMTKTKDKHFRIIVLSSMLVLSLLFLISSGNQNNLSGQKYNFDELQDNKDKIDSLLSNQDYLITSTNDKTYYGIVNIISWWGGPNEKESDRLFNEKGVADITKFILAQHREVYFLSDKTNSNYLLLLEEEGLEFWEVPEFQGLYKVKIKNEN